MGTTKLGRAWLLGSLCGLIVLCLPAIAQAVGQRYAFGAIPMSAEKYRSYLKVRPSAEQQMSQAALPAAYNAADLGFVTPAKNQGTCAACWAFASVGAMESKLLMSGVKTPGSPLDVSEQQQISCNLEQFGCGGGFLTAPLFWAPPPNPNYGPLPEGVFPFVESDAPCYNPSGSQIRYRVTDFYTVPLDVTEFKASLYADGPGLYGFLIMEDFLSFWESAPPNSVYTFRSGDVISGHAVLLIGWDDEKQAFLLKNSFGATAGPNGDGTFWMSYADIGNPGSEMTNFRIMVDNPPTPVPVNSHWALVLAALSLLLVGVKSLRR